MLLTTLVSVATTIPATVMLLRPAKLIMLTICRRCSVVLRRRVLAIATAGVAAWAAWMLAILLMRWRAVVLSKAARHVLVVLMLAVLVMRLPLVAILTLWRLTIAWRAVT